MIALNDTNFADWNFGRDDFPKEEYTTTTVAWKGACKSVPVTRVYKTLWVNPHPEREIKEVVLTERDLSDDQCRFVAHLGLTAAILPADKQPAAGRDAAKSQQLLQEALKLLADGKSARRRRSFRRLCRPTTRTSPRGRSGPPWRPSRAKRMTPLPSRKNGSP